MQEGGRKSAFDKKEGKKRTEPEDPRKKKNRIDWKRERFFLRTRFQTSSPEKRGGMGEV